MKQLGSSLADNKNKYLSLAALFTGAVLVTAFGIWFISFSITNGTMLHIATAEVPGYVLGTLVAFFGARYFFRVIKLSRNVLKDTAFFSWGHFKKVNVPKLK